MTLKIICLYILYFELYFLHFTNINLLFYSIVCKKNPEAVSSFEEVLFPIFQIILQEEVQGEFSYYFNCF